MPAKPKFGNLLVIIGCIAFLMFLASFYSYFFVAGLQNAFVLEISTLTWHDVFTFGYFLFLFITVVLGLVAYWFFVPYLNSISATMAPVLLEKGPISRADLFRAIGGRKVIDQGTCYREIKRMVKRKIFLMENNKIRLNPTAVHFYKTNLKE